MGMPWVHIKARSSMIGLSTSPYSSNRLAFSRIARASMISLSAASFL
jgi:hypothetical protein